MEPLTFIDAPLDADEREAKISEKRVQALAGYRELPYLNPYDGVMAELKGFPLPQYGEIRDFEVEPWLLPAPNPAYLNLVTVENFVVFIDADGCREYAEKLERLVRESVLPSLPVLVGVDHSLTGGAVKALSREYGGENLLLVGLDSHFDGITPTVRCGLIQYEGENNPNTVFSPFDPFIRARPDSYNADSFLYYLVKEKVIPAGNIVVLGASDQPPSHLEKVEDSRVKRFINHYYGMVDEGITLVSRDEIKQNFRRVREALEAVDASHLYLSVDIDVGANAALKGARFLDRKGLSRSELGNLISEIVRLLGRGKKLAGVDVLETDVYRAGRTLEGWRDETYRIEAEILARVLLKALG
ncbi:MAG: hypothetical protein DRO46_04100 [Candidatus Hecatellales archaeon]|nr:MAG: hypothetical protein DRO46_04100 [Candidatus Hecatellales archaeon]